jgi:23S rRNA pseudouridine1911/1915/1917 synthase
MTTRAFVVSGENAGTRIDLFLTQQYPDESRSAIQKWFNQNLILVNSHPAKPSYKLHSGDQIVVKTTELVIAGERALVPWNFALEILYEDDALLGINKPAHIVVHPGAGVFDHTIVHAALHHYPEIVYVGHPRRPGVVHRLDKETSGVLLLAKQQDAYLRMTEMFKNRKIRKHYKAAVYGQMQNEQGRIEKPLGRDPVNRKKISIRARKTRSAVPLYKVTSQFSFGALLDVEILTGRTHQIRVHLSSENHPIIGDSKYGGGNWNRIPDADLRNQLRKSGFFGLHAFSLDFNHPSTGEPLHIEAPLPKIWSTLVT